MNREQRRAAEHGNGDEDLTQKRRPKDAPREEMALGESVTDTEGGGAPSGGQINGRQGDQQGMRR